MTPTSGMTVQDIEAALSEAYVNTIAARVGASFSIRSRDYGVDGSFHEIACIDGMRIECGATINYQLKASIKCVLRETDVIYSLKKDAYNRLVAIKNRSANPCILLLLHLPSDPDEWFKICEDYLQLRRCCYWVYWREHIPTLKTAEQIHIPRNHQFTPDALTMLFEKYNKGELR